MAQDRSRSAFDVRQPKHWSSVQTQMGRLISDDDWNEADAIEIVYNAIWTVIVACGPGRKMLSSW